MMKTLISKLERLNPADRKMIEDLAEFLIERHANGSTPPRQPRYLNLDAVTGMLADLAPDKTDVELQHDALDARTAKADRHW